MSMPDSPERTSPGATVTTSATAIIDAATAWLSPDIHSWGAPPRPCNGGWNRNSGVSTTATSVHRSATRSGFPSPTPLMWANRVIALPHGEWALAGIRFRDRNLERCFVDIIATSLPARPESLATLAPALEFFSEFSPKRLRIVIPDLDLFTASGDPAAPDTEPDLRVVAAALDEATPLSTGYVSLVSTNPDAASSLAERIYGRIAADNPVLLEWSHLSTASCLSDPADEGLLFTIRFRDEDAGVLALLRQDDYGLAGWLVEEKCVDPAFRGHNLSAAATVLVMRQLASHPDCAAIRDADTRPVI